MPPDRRRAAAPAETGAGEQRTGQVDTHDSSVVEVADLTVDEAALNPEPSRLVLLELAEHEAAIEAALDSWRQSAPQLAELTDDELLAVALALDQLDDPRVAS